MDPKQSKTVIPFKITGNWDLQSKHLKETYSQLTDADLKFEAGKENELLFRVGKRLEKSRDEVIILLKKGHPEHTDVDPSKAFIIVEIIEYIPNSVVIKTIIKKTTGNVSAVSIDSGEILKEKISPFDTFIQIIDGDAEIIINDTSHMLATGQAIIIPAHSRNMMKANVRFKMISTVIKSGYEEVSW